MKTLVLVGASFVEPGSPLASELSRLLGPDVEVIALGRRGARLSGWASQAFTRDDETLRLADAVLVFELGGNGVPSPGDVADVDAALRERCGVVRWVMPPAWPARHALTAGRRSAAGAALLDAGVATVGAGWAPRDADVAADGAHLTRAAYAAWAAALAPRARGVLAGPAAAAVALSTLALAVLVVVVAAALALGGS